MYTAKTLHRLRLAPLLALSLALASCSDVEFGESVVGGDLADVAPTVDVQSTLDATLDASVDATVDGGLDSGDASKSDGGRRCLSNAECTDAAARVCDVTSGRCVQCTPSNDTCPRGQYCNATTLQCADGCRNDDDCVLPSSGDGGADPRRYCDIGRHVCLACRRDAECPAGLFCAGGECTTACTATRPCADGLTCCGGACTDTQTNRASCGACGRGCDLSNALAVCRAGACVVGSCTSPFGDCDGVAANGCEADLRSVANCGACDRACPVRPHAASACDGARGACTFTCDPGFADCNGRLEDGCEADLSADPANCNGCGLRCFLGNATAACASGRCEIAACAAGWGDCDGVASNGCEADLRIDVRHCGACPRACVGGPNTVSACADGACRITCAAGFRDCDGVTSNGCEVDLRTDTVNCGACGTVCRLANASARCAGGSCAIAACATGFSDCNGRPDDGCEVDLTSSLRDCGACGRACAVGQVCVAGACTIDCGLLTRCGERCADLRSDPANCGVCGRACPTGQECAGGACSVVCRAPETLCDGRCVVTATDRSNCGRCGNVCPARPNASAACVASACVYACGGTFADCDRAAANGCEVDTASDARNCGACSAVCSFAHASATCAAGLCVRGACETGFGDCDGNPANGCEAALGTDARNCGRCGVACPTTCTAGACAPVVTIDRPTVVNTLAAQVVAMAGTRAAMLVDAGAMTIAPGTRVVLHQTQGPGAVAGNYEFNRVVASSGASLMLETPLRFTYTTDTRVTRAQIVAVAEYTDLFIGPTGQLTAPEWNGRTGGILAVETTGDLIVQGSVTMNGRGFRGPTRTCAVRNNCQYGFQGESWTGPGAQVATPNGGGGGGGAQGQDCAAGGGGAYAAGATRGSPGDCNGDPTGECARQCPNEPGLAGIAYGASNPSGTLHLGSAGGEGGADEDGGYPGAGGNGGGIVFLRIGGALTATGTLSANGVDGLTGNQFACGGHGCGMGGGGGGSGGAIRVIASRATLGTGLVTATGGIGGQCTCRTIDIRRASPAGNGGNGRVSVSAPTIVGMSAPGFDPL
jgi:Stigma-specific protein, Stig1